MDSCTFKLFNSYFDMIKLVRNSINIIEPQGKKKCLTFVVSFNKSNENILQNIWGDSNRYSQVISNFMSNAIKFTPRNGKVTVELDIEEQLDEEPDINVIKDETITIISKQSKNSGNNLR